VTGTDGALQLVEITASTLSSGSANLGKLTERTLRASGSGTRRSADPSSGWHVCLPHQGSSWVSLAAVSHDTTVWCPWTARLGRGRLWCSGDVVQLLGRAGDGEQADGSRCPVGVAPVLWRWSTSMSANPPMRPSSAT